jgi:hypothetical protein
MSFMDDPLTVSMCVFMTATHFSFAVAYKV